VITRGEIDVVTRVATAGGSHILGVERVLEREHDAVHRHLRKIRVASIGGVKLRRPLKCVGQVAEIFADWRRARR
jgi:hypothetical protein